MSLNKKKILLIGGSGFVGSRLINLLGKERCINIDKNKSPFFNNISLKHDIRNSKKIVIPKYSQFVVLLAAEHKDDVFPTSLYYDVNVQGTKNVLKSMDKAGVKNLIFTSSVAVYGLNKLNPDENHVKDPFNHYAKSKWQAEKVIKDWFDNDPKGKSVTIIRPAVIFGERNRGNVYNLLNKIIFGKFMMIGKGQNKKSMAYVGNIIAFIKNRMDISKLGYHVFNYADKPDLTMTEFVKIVEEKLGISISNLKISYWLGMLGGYVFDFLSLFKKNKFTISSIRVKKFCATTQFDASKAHSVFKAPFTIKQGLNTTLEHEFIDDKDDKTPFQ
jgi:GlcNAc-P-P-Und epimerase